MKKFITSVLSVMLSSGLALAVASQPASHLSRSGQDNSPVRAEQPSEGAMTLRHQLSQRTPGDFTFSPRGTVFTDTPSLRKAPSKIGAAGGTMYAWMDYDESGEVPQGFVEVDIDGTVTSLVPVPKDNPNYNFVMSAAYVRDGKIVIMGTQQAKSWFGWLNNAKYVYEFDFTGRQLSKYSIPDYNSVNLFTTFAYDSEHDVIYGQTHNAQGYAVQWGVAMGSDPSRINWLAQQNNVTDVLMALTFNQLTGKIIGIKASGEVVEVDPGSGAMTPVTNIEAVPYETALAYSPYDGGYYYGLCTDAQSAMQLLDAENFSVLSSHDLGRLMNFTCFFTPDVQKILPGAPGVTQYLGHTFFKGARSGAVRFKLPANTHAGNPIIGNVDWVLSMDGLDVRRGSSAAGSELEVKLEDVAEGMHSFQLTVTLGGKEGRYCTAEFYVGNDTPLPPSGVDLTESKVTWNPVTEGLHDGWVDPSKVTYNVYINGKQIAEGLKVCECRTGLTQEDILNVWEASVESVFDGKVSWPVTSNDIVYGQAMPLPVSLDPSEKEQRLFTITDNNFSPGTIGYITGMLDAEHEFAGFRYASGAYDANDWLYLPLMHFDDKEAVYEFSMNIFRTNFAYDETFEVKLLTDINPNTAVATIIPEGTVTDKNDGSNFDHRQEGWFQVPEAGDYYVGIHITSPARKGIVWMRKFNVEKYGNVKGSHPAAPAIVSAVGAEKGELKAEVTVTLPVATIDGTEIPADAQLTAHVQADGAAQVTATGLPGENVKVTIPTYQGLNPVYASVTDAEGRTGLTAEGSVYTGVDYPGLLDITYDVSDDDMTLILNWQPLSEGANGGYVESTGVDYYLVGLVQNNWQVVGRIGTDVTTCRVNAPAGSGPAIYTYGVLPVNAAGQAPQFSYVSAILCEPYQMPFLSDYKANKAQGYTYNRTNTSAATATGNPGVRFPAYATPDNARAYYCYRSGTAPYPLTYNVDLSKVSTLGSKHATVELNTYGGSCDRLDVYASAPGVQKQLVKSILKEEVEAGPTAVKFELPEQFQNKGWVEISLRASLPEGQTVIIYSYKIWDDVDFDFGVYDLSAPVKAAIGEEAKCTAYIRNYGNEANIFPGAVWTLTDSEGSVLARTEVPAGTEALASGDGFASEISFTPTADSAEKLFVTYALNPADNKDTNDSREAEISVVAGKVPVITDLHASEISFDEVQLAWTDPDHSGPVTESFEEVAPFTLDSESDKLADFKRHDGDGAFRYTLGGGVGVIPNSTEPASFMVWSSSQLDQCLNSTGVMPAVTGDRYLVAFCPQVIEGLSGVAADDWLISPELIPGSEFSFWERPITYQYGTEDVEIMYSTTTDDPEEFKLLENLLNEGDSMQGIWKQYSFTLPEDAKYFAIHYVSYDKMGIALDDIRFSPVGSDIKVTGFEVYRDGQLVGNTSDCTFSDATVSADTEYKYTVIPTLSDGAKGLDSNTLLIRTTGVDGILADADNAEWYNLQGVRVDAGHLEPGVYIRVKGEKAVKVIVK